MNPFKNALDHRKVIENELNDFVNYYRGDQIREVKALADKIDHMVCYIGSPISVMPMLESIVKGKLKTWATGCDNRGEKLNPRMHIAEKDRRFSEGKLIQKEGSSGRYENDFYKKVTNKEYIKGHFRWDFGTYTIDRETRDYIKMFLVEKDMTEVYKYASENAHRRKLRMSVRNMQVQQHSENCYTIEITTAKGNEYRYHLYSKDKLVSTNCNFQDPISPFEEEWVKTTVKNNYKREIEDSFSSKHQYLRMFK